MLASAKVAFLQAGPELVAGVIDALRNHPQPPSYGPAWASGKTAAALRFEATDDSLTLLGPRHFQALLTGRKPTSATPEKGPVPLHTILEQWAKDKGIMLKNAAAYKSFGYALAHKIHTSGTALHRLRQPSGLLDKVLTTDFLNKLKASIAAGEMVALATELRTLLAL